MLQHWCRPALQVLTLCALIPAVLARGGRAGHCRRNDKYLGFPLLSGTHLMRKVAGQKTILQDATLALSKFGNDEVALSKNVHKLLTTPIVVALPIISFASKTFIEGRGLVNRKVALELAEAHDDGMLRDILVENAVQRHHFYQQREEVENEIMQEKLADSERPVYGALDLPGIGGELSQLYGEIQLVLNPTVLDRATLTAGDSHDLVADGSDVQVATKSNPFPLFTDTAALSSSDALLHPEIGEALVEVQIWKEGRAWPVDFDKDVAKIRLSHEGLKQIAQNRRMPVGPKEERYLAYGRLFDTIKSFSDKHRLPFVDEEDSAWTKEDFQQKLDSDLGLGFLLESALTTVSGRRDYWNNLGLWAAAPGSP